MSALTLGCWAEQVPESVVASVIQGFGGGGRHLELPAHVSTLGLSHPG